MATTYGYVRVSSQDQNEDRQMIAIKEKLVDPAHLLPTSLPLPSISEARMTDHLAHQSNTLDSASLTASL